jgi:hypothetical protein
MLWLDGAVKREPAIDAWLDVQPPDLGALAKIWFASFLAQNWTIRPYCKVRVAECGMYESLLTQTSTPRLFAI